jgi:hypothetical protein
MTVKSMGAIAIVAAIGATVNSFIPAEFNYICGYTFGCISIVASEICEL